MKKKGQTVKYTHQYPSTAEMNAVYREEEFQRRHVLWREQIPLATTRDYEVSFLVRITATESEHKAAIASIVRDCHVERTSVGTDGMSTATSLLGGRSAKEIKTK